MSKCVVCGTETNSVRKVSGNCVLPPLCDEGCYRYYEEHSGEFSMKDKEYYFSLVDTIEDPKECAEVAYAISILSHSNKNLLDVNLSDDYGRSVVMKELLRKAVNNDK